MVKEMQILSDSQFKYPSYHNLFDRYCHLLILFLYHDYVAENTGSVNIRKYLKRVSKTSYIIHVSPDR